MKLVLIKSKTNRITVLESITGCILGTALGDAAGLKREGLSRDRAIWLHGSHPSPDLLFGRGYCSDDTEHTLMVGCAMLKSGGEPASFQKFFAGYLRRWLLSCPAGIGLGTLRAIIKSFFVGPSRLGVGSAGNGPAMRSALLGLLARDDAHLVELVTASTRVTHTDSRAIEGALIVARAARFALEHPDRSPLEFIDEALEWITGEEIRLYFRAVKKGIENGDSPKTFAEQQGWAGGPTGYINQTVPTAIYCWADSEGDLQQAITSAVLLGGDTDSIGAITGAIAGAGCGTEGLPDRWIGQLAEWPRDVRWMKDLAMELDAQQTQITSASRGAAARPAPSMKWGRTVARNLIFGVTVILLYFRRYIPIRDQLRR